MAKKPGEKTTLWPALRPGLSGDIEIAFSAWMVVELPSPGSSKMRIYPEIPIAMLTSRGADRHRQWL